MRISQALAGEITGAHFVDVETDEDYVYRNFPVDIILGNRIYCDVSGRNTGTERQRMRCTVELYDPDGILRGQKSATANINPGTVLSSGLTSIVNLDKEGTWVIRGILEADSDILDEYSWDAVNVSPSGGGDGGNGNGGDGGGGGGVGGSNILPLAIIIIIAGIGVAIRTKRIMK